MIWIRALAAAGLSIVFPGAGHAFLRDWGRAAVFAALFVSALVLFLPEDQIWAAASSGSVTEIPGIVEAETTLLAQFTLSFLPLFAAIDAGFQALGLAGESKSGTQDPSCPSCGKPLDAELEFCHWCTTRIEPEDDEESASP